MTQDIRDKTEEAKIYTSWFEGEWERNGVEDLVVHNKQLISNVDTLFLLVDKYKEALVSISNGNWSTRLDNEGLEIWETNRINPRRIADEALEE